MLPTDTRPGYVRTRVPLHPKADPLRRKAKRVRRPSPVARFFRWGGERSGRRILGSFILLLFTLAFLRPLLMEALYGR